MERLFSRVPGVGLIAENGCFVREPHEEEWLKLTNQERTAAWKEGVSHILAYYQERADGSWIERRHCSLVFHHGSAEDQHAAARLASECAGHINDACANQGIHAILVEGALVVEPADTNKASAAEAVWQGITRAAVADEGQERPSFLLVIGDGRDDECVFRWANKLEQKGGVEYVMTVALGSRSTEAKATLTQGVTGVLSCLERLAAPNS
jgi:trehalose-phosphatase